jgi:Tfp pilus assembly protein PilX
LSAADRGSATVEMVIVMPVVVLVVMLAVVGGRVTVAQAAVEAAARDAARQASIARTASQARTNAISSASASLKSRGILCESQSISVDVRGFAREVGLPAVVSATISCAVPLKDIGIPLLPGVSVRKASFTSPLDPYRGRSAG